MAKDKCCCPKAGPIVLFLVGLLIGGVIVGVLAAYGQLDFLSGKIYGTEHMGDKMTDKTGGVMFELDEQVEGAWVQVTEEADVEGAWVQMKEGAWVQLTSSVAGETKEGAWVQFAEGAWVQLADKAWVQFSDTDSEGAWVQMREGAWVQLTSDTQVQDSEGAWVQLSEGAWVQLTNNAWVQFREKGTEVEGAWVQ